MGRGIGPREPEDDEPSKEVADSHDRFHELDLRVRRIIPLEAWWILSDRSLGPVLHPFIRPHILSSHENSIVRGLLPHLD